MAKLRAAILAAGRGVRMGTNQPKSLVPIGDHQPLMHYIVRGLRSAGVDDVLVVTGFRPEAVQGYFSDHAEGIETAFIRNARYASWGNFHSLRLAIDQSPGMNLVVVNSDVFVTPAVYDRVIQGSGDLVLAVEQREHLEPEDMRVELQGDRVRAIGKDIAMASSHGEFCGVSLVRPGAARLYSEIATQLEWLDDTSVYYEDLYATIVERMDARAAFVYRGEYAEVDTPEDARTAAAVIGQHLEAFEQPQRTRETA